MDSDFEVLNDNMRIEGCCFEKSFTFLSGHTVPIYKIIPVLLISLLVMQNLRMPVMAMYIIEG